MKAVRRISIRPREYNPDKYTLEYDDEKLTPLGNGSGRILRNGNIVAEFTFKNEVTRTVTNPKITDLVEMLEEMISTHGEEEN